MNETQDITKITRSTYQKSPGYNFYWIRMRAKASTDISGPRFFRMGERVLTNISIEKVGLG